MKKYIILGGIVVIYAIAMLIYMLVNNAVSDRTEVPIKIDPNLPYVHTIDTFEDEFIKSRLPKVNLTGELAEMINRQVSEQFALNKLEMAYFDYEFVVYDNILSFVAKYADVNDSADVYFMGFMVYNINLTTGELVNNEELLELKDLTYEDVVSVFYKRLDEQFKIDAALNPYLNDAADKEYYMSQNSIVYRDFNSLHFAFCDVNKLCLFHQPYVTDEFMMQAPDDFYRFVLE